VPGLLGIAGMSLRLEVTMDRAACREMQAKTVVLDLDFLTGWNFYDVEQLHGSMDVVATARGTHQPGMDHAAYSSRTSA